MPRVNRIIHTSLPLLVGVFALLVPAGPAQAAVPTFLPTYLNGSNEICVVIPSGVSNSYQMIHWDVSFGTTGQFSYTPNNGSNPAYPFGGGGVGGLTIPGVNCFGDAASYSGFPDGTYSWTFGTSGYPTASFTHYMLFTLSGGGIVPDPGPPGATVILSVVPPDDPTFSNARATSTTFAFEGTGFVAEDDYVDGMTFTMRYFNNAGVPSNSVAGPLFSTGGNSLCNWMPDWLCPPGPDAGPVGSQVSISGETFTFPISVDGDFDFATTTNLQQVGKYTLVSSINRPTFSLFGFVLENEVLVSTTTVFMVATSSQWDAFADATTEQLDDLYSGAAANCTVDFSTVFGLADLGDCVKYLFQGPSTFIYNGLTNQIADIASRAPWGYATRIYVIFTGDTATSSLPSIAATIPAGLPMAGSSFDFSPWAPTEAAVARLSTTTLPGGTGSVLENFEKWWNIMWLVIFALWLFGELYETFGGLELEREDSGPSNPKITKQGRIVYMKGPRTRYKVKRTR